MVFGLWTVVREEPKRGHNRYYLCRCECGTEKPVYWGNLSQGYSTNCGCRGMRLFTSARRKHGMTDSVEYQTWGNMKDRCGNPSNKSYQDYGARGITVCDKWINDFAAFFADMGPRPSPQHTIERVNNDKGYSPDNCVWATKQVQKNNTRRNRRLTFNGETLTITEWSRRLGGHHRTVAWRLKRGWSLERALTEPRMVNQFRHR